MKTALLLAAALLPVVAASAQTAPPPGAPSADRRAEWQARHAEHEQQMRQDLATVLGLKPAQQPALETWLAAMHPPHGPRDGEARERPAALTTPEKLDEAQRHMQAHEAEDQARIAATRRFYAQLDPAQQKVFDALGRLRHGAEGLGGHDHGPGGWHHHGGPDGAPPSPPGGGVG